MFEGEVLALRSRLAPAPGGASTTGRTAAASTASRTAAAGEVVFNTVMTGYQEVLTDPSYAGQMIAFTYPHIGQLRGRPRGRREPAARSAAGLISCAT